LAKVRRVFEVAKELGVASKAIVEKCKAENVPSITNHMSTVKVGLEATIKEWFSDSASVATAIETTEKVDLTKARKACRRRKGESDDEPAKVAEAPAKDKTTKSEAPAPLVEATPEAARGRAKRKPKPKAAPPATLPGGSPEGVPATLAEGPRPDTSEAPATTEPIAPVIQPADQLEVAGPIVANAMPQIVEPAQAVGRPNVPDRPKVVEPVGDLLETPKEAQLKGPRLVRIEQPDAIHLPKPRRAAPPQTSDADNSGPSSGGITRSRGPARGLGAGEERDAQPARKRRTLSSRRGRTADALPVGPSQFSQADIEELDARLRGATGFLKQRRRDLKRREQAPHLATSAAVAGGKVEIAQPITIKDLSAATGIKSTGIIKHLFGKGIMATINSGIGSEAAMEICLEYDIELEVTEQQTAEQQVIAEFETRESIDIQPRVPVVTVLGHVDHGKTSLLDKIRVSDVAAGEDGGITQHVGAYRVTIKGTDEQDKTVVFLDTPGHEAFTSMRARGTNMTDLVVLVVAADDGVMPQTVESINHARAAEVPIIVALNKTDLPQATEENIRRIHGQLSEHGLNPAEWGGQTEVVKVSAETGAGIPELLEIIDYQAQLLELASDFAGPARGVVIESQMKEGRGPVARVLVQAGRLEVGGFCVAGRAYGRVRDITDDRGKSIKVAGPSTPLEFSGLDVVPDAGDKFYVTDTLHKAQSIATQYRDSERQLHLATQTKVSLDNFAEKLQAGDTKTIRVVLKADAQGSVDVLRKSLEDLGTDDVAVRTLHLGVGGITESDVLLADASDAIVIGFHVIASPVVRDRAEQRRVEIRTYRVIYELIDDVRKAMEGLLDPETKEESIGEAEIREVFRISKVGVIAGCVVTEGSVQRGAKARVIRDGVVVTEDRAIETLRRVKDDVREVRSGTECGVRISGYEDVKPGDRLMCYRTLEVKRTLG